MMGYSDCSANDFLSCDFSFASDFLSSLSCCVSSSFLDWIELSMPPTLHDFSRAGPTLGNSERGKHYLFRAVLMPVLVFLEILFYDDISTMFLPLTNCAELAKITPLLLANL